MARPIPIVLALILCAPVLASADDDTGFYVGIGGNRLDANFDDADDLSFDDSDTTGSLKAGFMLNTYFGVEGGYLDLGNYQGNSGFTIDADAFQLAGVFSYPLADQFNVYGKLGAFFITAKEDRPAAGLGVVGPDEDTTEVYAAVGGEIDFGALNIFAEYSVVDTDISNLNIDIITIGIKYEVNTTR